MSGQPREGGIDTSRYEALDAPATVTDLSASATTLAANLEEWRAAVRQAQVSSTHLETRLTNLSLLERFGKNAWLIGNSQLEDLLRALERELVDTRGRIEDVHRARKTTQEAGRAEMETLEQTWREGIGKVLETEIASEKLRLEILDRRRQGV